MKTHKNEKTRLQTKSKFSLKFQVLTFRRFSLQPNPFSAPQQQSNPLASLLGLSAPPVPHQQHQQLQQHQQQQHQHQMQLQQQPPSHQHQQQHHQQSPSMHQHQPPYQPPSIIPQRPYSPQAPQSDDFRRQKNPTAQPISKRPPGCKSIFLAALPDSTTDADIHALFESCGKIEAIRWLNDRVTGRFRGCGFVDFSDDVAPVKAVNFNGYLLHGVPIRVDYAIPRRDDERDNRRWSRAKNYVRKKFRGKILGEFLLLQSRRISWACLVFLGEVDPVFVVVHWLKNPPIV